METSTFDARDELELIVLDNNKQRVLLDVKILYTNVPVSKAIEISIRCLRSVDHAPHIERSTLKLVLKLAVTGVYFNCKKIILPKRRPSIGRMFGSDIGKYLYEIVQV